MNLRVLVAAACCTVLVVGVSTATAAVVPVVLTQSLCNSTWTINEMEVIRIKAQPDLMNVIGSDCRLTFIAHESSIQFSFFDGLVNFIDPDDVSLKIYADDEIYPKKEFRKNSNFVPTKPEDLFVRKIIVELDGNLRSQYQLVFDVSESNVNGISLACGVFALSVGGTTAITLLALICYCCCCRQRRSDQQKNRQQMINQLRRSGYIVTRGYGSTDDTSPLLEEEPHHPYHQNYGATSAWPNMVGTTPKSFTRDPPPSYDDIRSRSGVGCNQLRTEAVAVERNQQTETWDPPSSGSSSQAGAEADNRSFVTADVEAPPAFGSAQ